VTFSQAQRDFIQMELDRVLKDDPILQVHFTENKFEPFFVKNLELVQGDERDVMIFSVGYGFDETGKFLLNFGPLNREGGERRLNVAVTRARYRVKLVASIQPEDIDLSRTNSRGVRLLRSYMSIARDGVRALYADISVDPDAEFESPFEASVYEALSARGIQLQKQVGVSNYRIDLAVVDPHQPGRYLLGIECDGAMYHAAATARDRDRLRQQVLEDLGWRIHRIWSRDWIENKEREIEKVLKAVEAARNGKFENPNKPMPKNSPTNNSPTTNNPRNFSFEATIRPTIAAKPSLPPGVKPYEEARIRVRKYGTEGFYQAYSSTVLSVVESIVNAEGPIEFGLLRRRVADTWRIPRMGSRIKSKIDGAIYQAHNRRLLKLIGGFAWPANEKSVGVRVPQNGKGSRSIEEIAPEELTEGIYLCVKSGLSIKREDLIKETARLFGLRATSKVTEEIEKCLTKLLKNGRLVWLGDKIRLPQR
jgi:very-short-patch-repair endonuclease